MILTPNSSHSVATARKNHNAIWGLEDEEGTLVERDQDLKDLGVRNFKRIFCDDNLTTIFAHLKIISLYGSRKGPQVFQERQISWA